MDNKRKRVDNIAVEQNIELDKLGGLIIGYFVVKRCVAACTRFERVKEIVDDFVERKLVVYINCLLYTSPSPRD